MGHFLNKRVQLFIFWCFRNQTHNQAVVLIWTLLTGKTQPLQDGPHGLVLNRVISYNHYKMACEIGRSGYRSLLRRANHPEKKNMQNMSTTIAVDVTNQPNKHRFCTRFSAINCAELTKRWDKKSHVSFYFHLSMKCGVVHTYHVSMPWRVGVSDYQIQDFKEIINRSTPARWDQKPSSRGPIFLHLFRQVK